MALDLQREIRDFVASYHCKNGTKYDWREPVIGIARATDPLFAELKTIVGPTHALPEDIVPGAKSVIAYFVPNETSVVESNVEGEASSIEWATAYDETNKIIADLNQHLYDLIKAGGFNASNVPATYNYDAINLRSDWSHRSAAFIAGVGTFGVHNMLITEQGCCGRIGSVITDMPLEPTPRPTQEHCLYKRTGRCKACIARCVIGALSVEEGNPVFDRQACNVQLTVKMASQRSFPGNDTCGKCMVNVPCSLRIP